MRYLYQGTLLIVLKKYFLFWKFTNVIKGLNLFIALCKHNL